MTNGDAIRSLSDDEMARFLRNIQISTLAHLFAGCELDSYETLLEFVQSEEDSDESDSETAPRV